MIVVIVIVWNCGLYGISILQLTALHVHGRRATFEAQKYK